MYTVVDLHRWCLDHLKLDEAQWLEHTINNLELHDDRCVCDIDRHRCDLATVCDLFFDDEGVNWTDISLLIDSNML